MIEIEDIPEPKTVDEIFDWLVRHAKHYRSEWSNKELKEMAESFLNGKDVFTLRAVACYVSPLHAPLDDFVVFIGEPYSYTKHLKPLIEAKLLNIVENDDPEWDELTGIVKDYRKDKCFVRFWFGERV